MTRLRSSMPRFFIASRNAGALRTASATSPNSSPMIGGWTPSGSASYRRTSRVARSTTASYPGPVAGPPAADELLGGFVGADGHEADSLAESFIVADRRHGGLDLGRLERVERVLHRGRGRVGMLGTGRGRQGEDERGEGRGRNPAEA